MYDFIVVGSGCTGAMAAQTLVESGKKVLMVDVGFSDSRYKGIIPDETFLDIRKNESKQYKYILGKDLEGISWYTNGKGDQITPPRKFMFKNAESLAPTQSDTFLATESLAYGGLGNGWGIGCWEWSDIELTKAGLKPKEIISAYQVVADRIGISGTKDSASEYTVRDLHDIDPSPHADGLHSTLYKRYKKRETKLNELGLHMGRTPLALITRDRGERKGYKYDELGFYDDTKESAYRPWITVNQLKKYPNFTYLGNKLVTKFSEKNDTVEVTCIDVDSKKSERISAKRLVLSAGTFGSARIVLRSGKSKGVKLPILCNPYSYMSFMNPFLLGSGVEKEKLEFANLSLFLDEAGDNSEVSMASMYGYQSLMLFRVARQSPLSIKDTRSFLQYMTPSLSILGVHHPDHQSKSKYLSLTSDPTSPTGDSLKIHYKLTQAENNENKKRDSKYVQAMMRLGMIPVKNYSPRHGAGLHYAGSLPYSETEQEYRLDSRGKLYGYKNVYVSDGSGFTFLPAKGLTFTLMANSHRVAGNALND